MDDPTTLQEFLDLVTDTLGPVIASIILIVVVIAVVMFALSVIFRSLRELVFKPLIAVASLFRRSGTGDTTGETQRRIFAGRRRGPVRRFGQEAEPPSGEAKDSIADKGGISVTGDQNILQGVFTVNQEGRVHIGPTEVEFRTFIAEAESRFTAFLNRMDLNERKPEMEKELTFARAETATRLEHEFGRPDLAITFLVDTPESKDLLMRYAPTLGHFDFMEDAANRLYRLTEIRKQLGD